MSDEPSEHFVIVAYGKGNRAWNCVGTAESMPDGGIRMNVNLLSRTLFLRPVESAAEAKAWPVTADERDVWPTREGS